MINISNILIMKNYLKFILAFGMTTLLSACMMSSDDRIKDNRMKCEMQGFLPGSDPFAGCVKRLEGRHTALPSKQVQ